MIVVTVDGDELGRAVVMPYIKDPRDKKKPKLQKDLIRTRLILIRPCLRRTLSSGFGTSASVTSQKAARGEIRSFTRHEGLLIDIVRVQLSEAVPKKCLSLDIPRYKVVRAPISEGADDDAGNRWIPYIPAHQD